VHVLTDDDNNTVLNFFALCFSYTYGQPVNGRALVNVSLESFFGSTNTRSILKSVTVSADILAHWLVLIIDVNDEENTKQPPQRLVSYLAISIHFY
jgi:hypothetical protein